jgi:hypothetical protein
LRSSSRSRCTFGLRLVRRFAQKRSTLLIEFLIFVFELVTLLLGFSHLNVSVCKFLGDLFFSLIDGVKDRFI